ncbi:MAG: hypothetical protein IJY50_09905 [Clostridia bacterium]|nr:hypothetical protein [Clostridia bacterium]
MLYPKNKEKELSLSLFQSPTSEYRGTPFWAWNSDLEEKELLRQIDVLQKMGFGGFHMHVRAGMSLPYLSDTFMDRIEACVEKARSNKMLAWLYDEDRWPSGFAGGLVTKDPQFRQRFLVFAPLLDENGSTYSFAFSQTISADGVKIGKDKGAILGTYDIVLDENGSLRSYRLLKDGEKAEGIIWQAYLQVSPTSPRFNNQSYVNTLDKKAMDRFIEITYEAYKKRVGKDFGGVVPAMFTDEPQFARKQTLSFAQSLKSVLLPWTEDLPDTFQAAYHEDLLTHLPELIWEKADGKPSTVRYHYHDHVCQRFTEAFADNCGNWCKEHGLALTGHMMQEPTLHSQTGAVGEVMRAFRSFELPGIDMLADRREYTTAKQAQSAAHQYGREGVMSELYGVTGWDFDFRRHKISGDWQTALGVTIRVPHLSWVSMKGEAKRDYPASINYQSPWYQEYNYIEDHFARVHTALTRGCPVVRVGVIHPVESYWMHWGPSEQTALAREQLDNNFKHVTEWLLFGSIDFDYISESLLPELCETGSAPLQVGKMAYDVIVVPGCETLRSSTLDRLEAFQKAGGKLIFMGKAPTFADAVESPRPAALYEKSDSIAFSRSALLDALEPYRLVEIRNASGAISNDLLHQYRKDGDCHWLFVARGKLPYNHDLENKQIIRVTIKGQYAAELYDSMNGTIAPLDSVQKNGNTVLNFTLHAHDSLLIKLTPFVGDRKIDKKAAYHAVTPVDIPARVNYTLDEPNALLMDMAELKLDDEAWRPVEELLRADTAIRKQLKYDVWGSSHCQPWCMEGKDDVHQVKLRFTFESEIDVKGAKLAAELPDDATIVLDGKALCNKPDGFYVDHDIRTYALPTFQAGTHVLELTFAYDTHSALEWCYLLGEFGVYNAGRYNTITKLPAKLGFTDITKQYLPFYSGKLTYHVPVESPTDKLKVRVCQYRASTVLVSANGGVPQQASLAPFTVILDANKGANVIDLDAYISRTNGFGPVHLADRNMEYVSPKGWRTEGDSWTYEYLLHEEGICSSPVIEAISEEE